MVVVFYENKHAGTILLADSNLYLPLPPREISESVHKIRACERTKSGEKDYMGGSEE